MFGSCQVDLPCRNVSDSARRVLIVDDSQDAAEMLRILFELDGNTVCLAHDGPSAVAEAAAFQPDLILMDLALPGFDGVEAIRMIRSSRPEQGPCIIALTGSGRPNDRDDSRAAGADVHLVKPVRYADLLAVCSSGGEPAAATVTTRASGAA